MGSAWCRQDVWKERTIDRSDHDDRSHDAGRNRARGAAAQVTAEGQDHPCRSLLGVDPWSLHGESTAEPFLCVRRHWTSRGPFQELRRGVRRARQESAGHRRPARRAGTQRGGPSALSGWPGLSGPTQVVKTYSKVRTSSFRPCSVLHLVRPDIRCETSTSGSMGKASAASASSLRRTRLTRRASVANSPCRSS